MTDPRRISALAHRAAVATPNGELRLAEVPFLGKLTLRGDPDRIGGIVQSALGLDLPRAVKGTAANGKATAIWTAPDEWWLVTRAGEEAATKGALELALAGVHSQVTDITDYYTTISVEGPRAREALMKLMTVDLHPRMFKPGEAVLAMVGRANPLVWLKPEAEFEIHIRISMADYLWCALCEAGHEWGLDMPPPKGEVRLHLPHFDVAVG